MKILQKDKADKRKIYQPLSLILTVFVYCDFSTKAKSVRMATPVGPFD